MLRTRLASFTFAALLALLASCASSGSAEGGFRAPPASFNGYPPQALEDIVVAEARVYTNHAEIFKRDLTAKHGIVPVALKIGLRGEGQETSQVRVTPDGMNLRLYLQDGTILASVPASRVASMSKRSAERVTSESLKPGLLGRWEDAPTGFVFFELRDRDRLVVKGDTVLNRMGQLPRTLELSSSLCSFDVIVGERRQTFHVGLQRDRR